MYRRLLSLELKQLFRNPQFGANLVMKILTGFFVIYTVVILAAAPFGVYFFAKEQLHMPPLHFFCSYFLFIWAADLLLRYFFQQLPTQNLKPFLTQNLIKKTLVNYTFIKTFLHFFNWGYLVFLIPFAVLLIAEDNLSAGRVMMWLIAILFSFYFNNFLNILMNKKDTAAFILVACLLAAIGANYFGYIDLNALSERIFMFFYETPGAFLIPVLLTAVLAFVTHRVIWKNFYLDKGLELQKSEGKTENIAFLNRFGVTGTFLNNDIRLLRRSKAAKSALVASFVFLFYGLLFFSGIYKQDFMKFFAGIFITVGFMLMFGGRVPAWDSTSYPLMMTLDVPYKKYLMAKWSLIVLAIAVSMVLALGYLYYGVEIYLTIVAAGLYNLGVNSYLTLLAGAYNKQSIDLNSASKGVGKKNSFNLKTMLISLPQLLLPMLIFTVILNFYGIWPAVAVMGVLGLIGILLRDKIFDLIVKVYRTEKYAALEAFKKAD